jgi:hypothetical protein
VSREVSRAAAVDCSAIETVNKLAGEGLRPAMLRTFGSSRLRRRRGIKFFSFRRVMTWSGLRSVKYALDRAHRLPTATEGLTIPTPLWR